MTAGRFYSFTYKATNGHGDSPLANILTVPVADIPLAPAAPSLVLHSQNYITVEWAETSDQQGAAGKISGYYLYMDNGFHENFQVVWNGEGTPDVRSHTSVGLTAGRPYQFKV